METGRGDHNYNNNNKNNKNIQISLKSSVIITIHLAKQKIQQ